MKQFTLYVGLLDKDTKQQEISDELAKEIISNEIGDCSISDMNGYYTHENGQKITEKSLRVEILFRTLEEIKLIASVLKKKLNQESIALSVQEIESELL